MHVMQWHAIVRPQDCKSLFRYINIKYPKVLAPYKMVKPRVDYRVATGLAWLDCPRSTEKNPATMAARSRKGSSASMALPGKGQASLVHVIADGRRSGHFKLQHRDLVEVNLLF